MIIDKGKPLPHKCTTPNPWGTHYYLGSGRNARWMCEECGLTWQLKYVDRDPSYWVKESRITRWWRNRKLEKGSQ